MSAPVAEPERRIRLEFRAHHEVDHADQPVRSDLSTVAANGRCLWTANDELATLERLVRQEDGGYGDHQPFPLAELYDAHQGAVVTSDRLELVRHLPVGRGDDHPEEMCWLPDSGAARELLVVYDSPAKHRLHGNTAIDADVFRRGRKASRHHKQRSNRRH